MTSSDKLQRTIEYFKNRQKRYTVSDSTAKHEEVALVALQHLLEELNGTCKTAYDENHVPYLVKATGSEAEHIIELLTLEAQDKLVKLPCKVGDKFDLVFDEDDIVFCIVNSFECDEDGDWFIGYKDLIFGNCTEYMSFDEFEAEAKLKERNENE